MLAEFTAVFKTAGNNRVRAQVVELPDIRAEGRTTREARAKLVQAVRKALEARRVDTLAHVEPGARVERIRVRTKAPTEIRRKPRQAGRQRRSREPDLLQVLLQQGLINAIPPLDALDTDKCEPIHVEGKPISEEIIEARR
jgi:hypothetical protein